MAKFSLIQFWEFLNEHLDQNLSCLMETDTDSLYLALTRSRINDKCVNLCPKSEKPEPWSLKHFIHTFFYLYCRRCRTGRVFGLLAQNLDELPEDLPLTEVFRPMSCS